MDGDRIYLQTTNSWFVTRDNVIKQTLELGYDDFSLVALSGYQHDRAWKPLSGQTPDTSHMTRVYPTGELSPDEMTPDLVGC
jgi:hypothetical protein